MKTETQIAEEIIEKFKLSKGYSPNAIFHKATCQRFLEKIETDLEWANAYQTSLSKLIDFPDFLMASIEGFIEDKKKEQTDKKNAIKLYSEAGI